MSKTFLKVLIACEFSGTVREAFRKRGHDAWSCDLLPTEVEGQHLQCDVREVLERRDWDLMIAHPPCTHLAVSGARHFHHKEEVQEEALDFFLLLLNAPIPQICVENPVGVVSSRICKPRQIIQPYEFGNPDKKTTCLWLKALPPLEATCEVSPLLRRTSSGKIYPRWHWYGYFKDKEKSIDLQRGRTFKGIAEAMAEQWGNAKGYCWRSESGYRGTAGYVKKPRTTPCHSS